MAITPFLGFVTFFRGLLQEESGLMKGHTCDGFDLNVYKLMKKSDYNSANHHLWGVSLKQDLMSLMTPRK